MGIALYLDKQEHLPGAGRVWYHVQNRRGEDHFEGETTLLEALLGSTSGNELHAATVNHPSQCCNEKVSIISNQQRMVTEKSGVFPWRVLP
jgi:hypothetical protein